MKSEKNSLEGQMDIFEAMNRAAAAVDKMVEEEQEARHKKNKSKSGKSGQTAEEIQPETASTEAAVLYGCDMHASMQKTFVNIEDDDFATVAYIDYNMIYWKDWNSPVSLRKFDTAREAVDFYFEQLEKLKKCSFAEMAEENEPFCNVKYVVENIYVECED